MAILYNLVKGEAYKWQRQSVASMPFAPVRIAPRFEAVFLEDSEAGISELVAITEVGAAATARTGSDRS
jgi:hypothetical protein